MAVGKYVQYHIRMSWSREWKKYFFVYGGLLFLCILHVVTMDKHQTLSNCWEVLLGFFQGIGKYHESEAMRFYVPPLPFLYIVFFVYLVGGYVGEQMYCFEVQCLVRCSGRIRWVLSIFTWMILQAIIYFMAAFSMLYASASMVCGQMMSVSLDISAYEYAGVGRSAFGLLILSPLIASIFFGGLQILFSMHQKRVWGIVSNIFLFITAVYVSSDALPGNLLMNRRSNYVDKSDGISFELGGLIAMAYVLFILASLLFWFKSKDMLRRNEES